MKSGRYRPTAEAERAPARTVVAVFVAATVTADHLAMAAIVPLGWLVADGFLEDRSGDLTWHGSTDISLILLLVVAAAIGLAAGEVRGQLAAHRDIRRNRTP